MSLVCDMPVRWAFNLQVVVGRVSPRRARYFSCSAKKSTQKKAAPADCVPSLRCGQPVVLGHGLHRETHYAPQALRSNRRGESVHEAVALCGATAQPMPCAPRRIQKGLSRHGPSLRSACLVGRAQRWPTGIWLLGCSHSPFACAWGVVFVGWHWHRRVPVHRELACRVCSNGAPWRVESFAAHPTNATTQVALRNAKGRKQQGDLLLGTFLRPAIRGRQEKYLARRAKSGQQHAMKSRS